MSIIMKDQIYRTRPLDDKKDITDILLKMLIAFAIFCSIAIGFTLISIAKASTETSSIASATYDNLMSEEMAAYTVLYGHGQEYEEFDMD